MLKDVGLELFLIFGHTILLAFDDTKVISNLIKKINHKYKLTSIKLSSLKERNEIYNSILKSKKLKNLIKSETIDEATNLWKEGKISNYEYLMQLNKYSGRTFNDLMQYPIYPHILSNYDSDTLDLASKENYR